MSGVNPFEAMVPVTARDRLGFLNPSGDSDRVKLFAPELDLERVIRCTGCGMDIAVGPCFEHIDPESFLGAVCGCETVEPLQCPTDAAGGAGSAGTGQDGAENG